MRNRRNKQGLDMTHVLIGGIEYVPRAEVPEITDERLKAALTELVSLHYYGDWHKAKPRTWDAINALAPELAKLLSDDPQAAYYRLSPPDSN